MSGESRNFKLYSPFPAFFPGCDRRHACAMLPDMITGHAVDAVGYWPVKRTGQSPSLITPPKTVQLPINQNNWRSIRGRSGSMRSGVPPIRRASGTDRLLWLHSTATRPRRRSTSATVLRKSRIDFIYSAIYCPRTVPSGKQASR